MFTHTHTHTHTHCTHTHTHIHTDTLLLWNTLPSNTLGFHLANAVSKSSQIFLKQRFQSTMCISADPIQYLPTIERNANNTAKTIVTIIAIRINIMLVIIESVLIFDVKSLPDPHL